MKKQPMEARKSVVQWTIILCWIVAGWGGLLMIAANFSSASTRSGLFGLSALLVVFSFMVATTVFLTQVDRNVRPKDPGKNKNRVS